jgi:hypothetical protein
MARPAKLSGKEKDYFCDLVKKVGGRNKAAKVMGVHPKTVTNHAGGKPSIGGAKIRKLEGQLGLMAGPATVGDQGRHEFLSLDDLTNRVESLRWSDSGDGFQRKLAENRVAEIEAQLRSGMGKFQPIMIGELPNGRWIEIDGQHRRAGHIAAQLPCHAWIVQVKSIEEARELYLHHNGKMRPIAFKDRYEASRNPLRMRMKAWEGLYSATTQQVAAVVRGVIGDKSMDLLDPTSDMEESRAKRVDLVLKIWSADSRWGNTKTGSVYTHTRMLRTLGVLSKDCNLVELRKLLKISQAYRGAFHKNGTWARSIRDEKRGHLINAVRAYVFSRLNGGLEGRKANRA